MTDNEIIKALECLSGITMPCAECAYNDEKILNCKGEAESDALDLINRQQAEIERLKKENEQFADIGKMYSEVKSEVIKEFAERLKKEIQQALVSSYKTRKEQSEKKSILGGYMLAVVEGRIGTLKGIDDFIDELVKEMVGEANIEERSEKE